MSGVIGTVKDIWTCVSHTRRATHYECPHGHQFHYAKGGGNGQLPEVCKACDFMSQRFPLPRSRDGGRIKVVLGSDTSFYNWTEHGGGCWVKVGGGVWLTPEAEVHDWIWVYKPVAEAKAWPIDAIVSCSTPPRALVVLRTEPGEDGPSSKVWVRTRGVDEEPMSTEARYLEPYAAAHARWRRINLNGMRATAAKDRRRPAVPSRPAAEALAVALSAIYLADDSDYLAALWAVIHAIDPDIAERMQEDLSGTAQAFSGVARCIGDGREGSGCGENLSFTSGDTCPECNGMVLDGAARYIAHKLAAAWDAENSA